MISKEVIEKIFDAVRIEDVVSDFVSLKRRGVNMIGLCPFHKEKTPSFYVSPAKNIYKCFGCGKGGNSVDFVMEHEKFTYPEALRYLAKKYHIEIEEQEQTAEEIASMNERESLFHLTAFAHAFFQEQLHQTDEGRSIGLSYLNERSIRADIIQKFQLGYSPEIWDAFTKKALANGYKKEFLEKTGLSIFKDDKAYDRFRGRIMFPIHGISGRVVGFGGRIMDKEKSPAKYVNSPESDIYHKSNLLYGLYLARTEISRKNICYLTEGYMDVISMHQAGIENVVASSGTSLTTEQIKLIKRFTPNITILYDGDAAGIKASFRGIDMILEEGMNVRIVLFPDGHDPDSFARERTGDEVKHFLDENARDFITFKADLLLKDTHNDPIALSQVVGAIINSISLIPNQITRELYVRQCADMMKMEEATVMNQLNQYRRKQYQEKRKREQQQIPPEDNSWQTIVSKPTTVQPLTPIVDKDKDLKERELVRLLVLYGSQEMKCMVENEQQRPEEVSILVTDYILNVLENEQMPYENRPFIDQFENSSYKQIVQFFSEGRKIGQIPTYDSLKNHPEKAIRELVIDLISNPYSVSDGWENKRIFTKTEAEQLNFACEHALLCFQSNLVGKKLQQIEQQLLQLDSSDEQKQNLFLDQYLFFTDIKKRIAEFLNRTEMVD
ncbi:MAG: DNA primase [Bacteroidales bacterium]|nr:DNA primase [Bacteroidales bacterium]